MPADERLVERVRALLADRRAVEKRMMGTLMFMVNGAICCTIGDKGLLVRIAPDDRDALLALPHVAPMTMGKRTMRGFVRVAPAGVTTKAALAKWIERGIAAGVTAPKRRR